MSWTFQSKNKVIVMAKKKKKSNDEYVVKAHYVKSYRRVAKKKK